MNGYYKDRIKVVGPDRMCFPAHPGTLEALACGCYDAHALSDPDPEPLETIGLDEWNRRRAAVRDRDRAMALAATPETKP